MKKYHSVSVKGYPHKIKFLRKAIKRKYRFFSEAHKAWKIKASSFDHILHGVMPLKPEFRDLLIADLKLSQKEIDAIDAHISKYAKDRKDVFIKTEEKKAERRAKQEKNAEREGGQEGEAVCLNSLPLNIKLPQPPKVIRLLHKLRKQISKKYINMDVFCRKFRVCEHEVNMIMRGYVSTWGDVDFILTKFDMTPEERNLIESLKRGFKKRA